MLLLYFTTSNRVTSCGSHEARLERVPHLLMSFQLIVGLLTVVGIGLASLALSKPWMKQGSTRRLHNPSADSGTGGNILMSLFCLSCLWYIQAGIHRYILSTNLCSVPPGGAGRRRWVPGICRPSHFGGERCGSALRSPCMKSCSSSGQTASNNLNVKTTHWCSSWTKRLLMLNLFQHGFIFLLLPKPYSMCF